MNKWWMNVLAVLPAPTAGVLGSLLVASWRGVLPDPVATHWSTDGADGFTSLGIVVVLPALIGLVGTCLGALAFMLRDRSVVRISLGIVVGVVVSTIVIVVLATETQRGLGSAGDAATPSWGIVLAWLVGLAAGAGSAALVRVRRAPEAPKDVGERPDVALAPGDRAVWTRVATTSAGATSVIAVALGTLITTSLVLRSWPVIAVAVVVLAVTALMWSVRVTVDRRGLAVRGRAGWPRTVIPISDLDHAEYVHIRALRDFGGFGYRVALHGDLKGAKGFVLRSGDALLVVRRDGGREVVVVDDARTAAGLINRLVGPAGRGESR